MAQTTFMLELTFTLEISSLLSAKAVNARHGSGRSWQQDSKQAAAFTFHQLLLL